MWKWLTRREFQLALGLDPQRQLLRLEALEAREVPAILINIDYSYDNGFFKNNPEARAVIERVAQELGSHISANLAAITPSGGNTFTPSFFNPMTGAVVSVPNLSVGANSITVYVGSRTLGGGAAGVGGFGGYSVGGSSDFISTVQTRGWNGFSPWGGSISFDNTKNWYFGLNTAGLPSNKLDFYSVAIHEMGHVLGIGTAAQWKSYSANGYFYGPNSVAVNGGPVRLSPDGAHWGDGVLLNGQPVSLDPTINYGKRVDFTALDYAALYDVGWSSTPVSPVVPPVPPPPPAPVPPVFNPVPVATTQPVAFTGSTNGIVTLYNVVNGSLVSTGQTLVPFANYAGAIRVAGGDFDGDGIQDYAFTVGAGPQSVVQILNGRDGSIMVNQTAIFPGFRGGLFVAAADIDRDGKAELVVSADAGAGPHIQTFRVVGGSLQLQSSFFAFDNPAYRGGARVAAGDLNHDGFADVVVVTGGLAEGRVAMYSGASLAQGVANRLYGDFAPFPGAVLPLNAAIGDMDGDGFGELVVTIDRGGPAHVKVWSGAMMATGQYIGSLPPVASFYAFPPNDPSGARITLRDTNGDGLSELIVGSGNPLNSQARVFSYSEAVSGAGGGAIYPVGTPNTYDGIYAGLHTDSTSDSTDTSDEVIHTVTVPPVLHHCNCAACRALAALVDATGNSDPFASGVPVT